MYRNLHCDFSNGPYIIAAATILLQVINMVRLYYSRAASIFSRAESISLSAPARVYYDLQPEARCFNPGRI